MKRHLLITTAIGLMLGTGAFAQSPSERSNPPHAAQSQTNANSPTSQAPPPSSTPSASSTSSTQSAQSTPASREGTTTSQSAPNATGSNDAARAQLQSNRANAVQRRVNLWTNAHSTAQSPGDRSRPVTVSPSHHTAC